MERGMSEKAKRVAENLFKRGISAEDVAEVCEEPIEQIAAWYQEWEKQWIFRKWKLKNWRLRKWKK